MSMRTTERIVDYFQEKKKKLREEMSWSSDESSRESTTTTSSGATSGTFEFEQLAGESGNGNRNGKSITDVDLIAINAKLLAITDETDSLRILSNQNYGFQQAIYDHKFKSRDQVNDLRSKLADLKAAQATFDAKWRKLAGERVEEVLAATEPYLKTGQAPGAQNVETMEKVVELSKRIGGLATVLEKTREMPAKVMRTHRLLNEMERKQRDAMSRYEEVTRVENLHHDVPATDPIYQMAHLPELLLALSIQSTISPVYKNIFKELEQRIAGLVAQIRFNKSTNDTSDHAALSSSLEACSNGEIELRSIFDAEQHPLDSLKAKTPEAAN